MLIIVECSLSPPCFGVGGEMVILDGEGFAVCGLLIDGGGAGGQIHDTRFYEVPFFICLFFDCMWVNETR